MGPVPSLPAGVVTFLLTDVEGSTRLWEQDADAMRGALARHDAILAAGVRQQRGNVVKSRGEGDSIFAVFERARDAVAAALAIQRLLHAERWATRHPLRVRMAIHTGPVQLRERDYYGPTVNRCARLRALGHGGQVLLSSTTADLVAGRLPTGAHLADLGIHPLKDLSIPEHVWQLQHPLLPGAFPPLRSATTSEPASEEAVAEDGAEPSPEPPAGAESAGVQPRWYKVTDHLGRTPDGRDWAAGATHRASGDGHLDGDGWIRCYTSLKLAALLSPVDERFRVARLWEVAVAEGGVEIDEARVACREVTVVAEAPSPPLTARDFARFAVLCAREAGAGGRLGLEFEAWSDRWLAGGDAGGEHARALADAIESEVYGSGRVNPGLLAAANAARVAVHAARSANLGGRAREEATRRAAEVAAEAVHLASRVAHLDLAALADEAVPDGRLGTPGRRLALAV